MIGAAGEAAYIGAAYIFDGATGTLIHELLTPNPEVSGFFGLAVAGIGDVNGDGLGDVVVGAPWEETGASPNKAGRVYVFDGATGDLLQVLTSPNEEHCGHFGDGACALGDVDGDGFGDVAIAASWENDSNPPGGRVYIFLSGGKNGDLNRDGTCGLPDILRFVDILLGRPPEPGPYELWAADLDDDRDQDVFDILAMLDLALES